MSDGDRLRWNEKYRLGEHESPEPSRLLTALDSLLPRTGSAIDLAGGAGRHSIWLAQRGLSVTLADVSDVALILAKDRAADAGLELKTLCVDLEEQPLPQGPWDLIVSVHYLHRPLFRVFRERLADGGVLVCIQPTVSNLQRHCKPSRRFLLDDGELPSLIGDLQLIHYQEGWLDEGTHEAVIVARRNS